MKQKLFIYTVITCSFTLFTPTHADNFFQSLSTFFSVLAQNPTPKANSNYSLTHKQTESYIDVYLASIKQSFYPAVSQTDITQLNKKIEYGIANRSDLYIWVQGVRWYDKDKIDQVILSALLEVIEENSYTYALEQTNSTTIAHKIAQSIYNNALAITQKTTILDPIALKPFFGLALRQTIRHAITQFDTPYSYAPSAPPIQLYPSAICCICLDYFSARVDRVFLYPCGHDMCKLCAIEYFFESHGNTKNCPQCRSAVNIEQLFENLEI